MEKIMEEEKEIFSILVKSIKKKRWKVLKVTICNKLDQINGSHLMN
jgi:hypothetical protein